jgi:hypothetical protein
MEGEKALGRCIICGVIGRTVRDFICEECGNPNKIIHTCTNCGSRIDFTGIAIDKLKKAFGPNIGIGCAIAAPFCKESLCLRRSTRIYCISKAR